GLPRPLSGGWTEGLRRGGPRAAAGRHGDDLPADGFLRRQHLQRPAGARRGRRPAGAGAASRGHRAHYLSLARNTRGALLGAALLLGALPEADRHYRERAGEQRLGGAGRESPRLAADRLPAALPARLPPRYPGGRGGARLLP